MLTESEARLVLIRHVQQYRTRAAFAKRAGVHASFVGQVLAGRKHMGPTLARFVGLVPVVTVQYEQLLQRERSVCGGVAAGTDQGEADC